MCGIYSLLNVLGYNKPEIIKQLKELFSKGAGRGPDNSKFFDYSNEFNSIVGFHRLSINGLDNGSDQPLIINNKLLICNGEIYNYQQLYSMYTITPKTHSDCEVIIHLYDLVGFEKMIQMLDGVFAFNLLDFSVIQTI